MKFKGRHTDYNLEIRKSSKVEFIKIAVNVLKQITY